MSGSSLQESSLAYECFEYDLPPERIAARPLEDREAARLLVLGDPGLASIHAADLGEAPVITDSYFSELPHLLQEGDVLVLNTSKVVPVRLHLGLGRELFLLRPCPEGSNGSDSSLWHTLIRPMRKFRIGQEIPFSETAGYSKVVACIEEKDPVQGTALVRISLPLEQVFDWLYSVGSMPIPPYIRGGVSDEQDSQDYQTVFAESVGSIAAPTAGLHFTDALLETLSQKGVEIIRLTLHVGPLSFLPVGRVHAPELLEESYSIPHQTALSLRQARNDGRRIIPVGTTSLRAIESAAERILDKKCTEIISGATQLLIQPGYTFKLASGLITNFHQPGTSHLMLVEALIGRPWLERVYSHALSGEYRFLSYGDGLLLPVLTEW